MKEENNMTPQIIKRIQQLLEQRDILTQMSVILYGDTFVESNEFWGSVTERQMSDIVEELTELGYVEHYDEWTKNEARRIFKKFFGDLPNSNLED